MSNSTILKWVAAGLVSIAFVLLGLLIYLADRQPAWTSHHAELVGMIHQCPGQHAAAKAAVQDGVLGLEEARRLIEDCTREILLALPGGGENK